MSEEGDLLNHFDEPRPLSELTTETVNLSCGVCLLEEAAKTCLWREANGQTVLKKEGDESGAGLMELHFYGEVTRHVVCAESSWLPRRHGIVMKIQLHMGDVKNSDFELLKTKMMLYNQRGAKDFINDLFPRIEDMRGCAAHITTIVPFVTFPTQQDLERLQRTWEMDYHDMDDWESIFAYDHGTLMTKCLGRAVGFSDSPMMNHVGCQKARQRESLIAQTIKESCRSEITASSWNAHFETGKSR